MNWKVFFSTPKIKSDIQLKERENRIYEFLITEFEYNNLQTIFTVKKFNQLFLDWNNEKFSEKLSVIPSRAEIEKVLKYYFVNNTDKSKCLYYAMNSDDVEFIIKEKIEIVKNLEKALNVNATTNIIKKENIA